MFVSVMLLAAGASASEVRGHFAGSSFLTAVDSNGDGMAASNAVTSGKSSRIGRFSTRGLVESLPWDFASFCSSTEIRFIALAHPIVITAANGDLIYTVLADTPTSDACFSLADGVSLRGTTYLTITGGTGRFAGGSGYFKMTWAGENIVNSSGLSLGNAFEGKLKGELIIAEQSEDDDA